MIFIHWQHHRSIFLSRSSFPCFQRQKQHMPRSILHFCFPSPSGEQGKRSCTRFSCIWSRSCGALKHRTQHADPQKLPTCICGTRFPMAKSKMRGTLMPYMCFVGVRAVSSHFSGLDSGVTLAPAILSVVTWHQHYRWLIYTQTL